MWNKFERTDGMRYFFYRIALAVCEIVHRVNAPFVAGAVMVRKFYPV
jgi:hypothetical protein